MCRNIGQSDPCLMCLVPRPNRIRLSIIIPYLERGDYRLSALIAFLGRHNLNDVQVVIFDQSKQPCRQIPKPVTYINSPHCGHSPYSPGAARNEAIKYATGDYIFFMDADLEFDCGFIDWLQQRMYFLARIGKQAFDMYPCLYLSCGYSKQMPIDYEQCLVSYLSGENDVVDGIALASSCLLINKLWFCQLQGFDERFFGHGGEDLELIHRLILHYPVMPRPDDYHLNVKCQHPGGYKGFRAYASYYSVEHLFTRHFLVHRWHPRPLTHKYHRRRVNNDRLLELCLMNCHLISTPLPCVLKPDISSDSFIEWLGRVQQHFDFDKERFPGLYRHTVKVQRDQTVWRKIRKLYLNPKLFFRDWLIKFVCQ